MADNEKMEEVKETLQKLNDTPDTTAEYDSLDIERNKGMAILAYIGILVLIPIFAAKESSFARFHANQGIILFIIGIVCSALTEMPVVGIVFKILDLVLLVLMILGIINAAKGRAKELPVIGQFKVLR